MDSRYVERHNAKRGIGSVGEVVGEGQLRQAETENAPAEDGLCVVDLEDDEDGCLDDVEQKARPHGRESADDRLQLAAAVKAPARPSPPPSGKEKEGCLRLHHGLLTLCPPAPGQLAALTHATSPESSSPRMGKAPRGQIHHPPPLTLRAMV